mmetsp:Transcript_13557/g.23071  ORF Transcript_13557/g.23071 Transcript_13557/m.23071 type:complete len:316 (-) Transcript_13557:34-981(-)
MGAVLSLQATEASAPELKMSNASTLKTGVSPSKPAYLAQLFRPNVHPPDLTDLSDDEDSSEEDYDLIHDSSSDVAYEFNSSYYGVALTSDDQNSVVDAKEKVDPRQHKISCEGTSDFSSSDPENLPQQVEIKGLEQVEDQTGDLCSYFEQCSSILLEKTWGANHLDKIGIGEAVYKLGELVYSQGDYELANNILERASKIQKMVMKESIFFVAWAMRQQGLRYRELDEDYLGLTYHVLATKLVQEPTQETLQLAWNIHQGIKGNRNDSAELEADRIYRRMKRARNECFPLAQTFDMRTKCKSRGNLGSSDSFSFQ